MAAIHFKRRGIESQVGKLWIQMARYGSPVVQSKGFLLVDPHPLSKDMGTRVYKCFICEGAPQYLLLGWVTSRDNVRHLNLLGWRQQRHDLDRQGRKDHQVYHLSSIKADTEECQDLIAWWDDAEFRYANWEDRMDTGMSVF